MRIVTYNTRGSLGMDEVRSTPRIAEVMRPLSADVLCFQEIHRRLPWSGREDQPAVLERLLSRQFLFQANFRVGFGGYGLGVAFRGTLAEKREHFLPSGKEQRGVLEARLRSVGGLRTLTVFCTHWGLTAEERLRQAEALAELVLAAPRPVVVCGDFNEPDSAPAMTLLLAKTGLVDADHRKKRNTFVSNNPTIRIDLILYSPDLTASPVEVIASDASDHLPLVADLR